VSAKVRNVREYIAELEKTMTDRSEQVKEGLEIFIELWRKAVENGVISLDDSVEIALGKIEAKGGLYKAAE
jgi:flagellar motor component MotA